MTRIDFDRMPDDGRLWVFGARRPLDGDEERILLARVDAFLDDWKAHGTPLTCARDWRYGRFLHVAVDERSAPPSGCSIDAMVRVLRDVEDETGVRLTDNAPVWFRSGDGGEIRTASRARFAEMADAGELDAETVVFDQTVTRVGQVRNGEWETPAAEAWHGSAFFGRR